MARKKKRSTKIRRKTKNKTHRHSPKQIKSELLDIVSLEQIVRHDPTNLETAIKLAEQYYKSNRETKIRDLLLPFATGKFKLGSPQSFRFLTLLAFGHAFTGNLSEAEQSCERGLAEFPDALDFYYLLSYVKFSLREYSSAIEHGHKYLQLLRDETVLEKMHLPLCGTMTHLSRLQNIIGNGYREQSQTDDAARHYDASIKADPGNHLPYLNLATMHYHLGNLEQANSIVSRGLASCVQVHELRMLSRTLKNRRTVSACLIVRDEEKLLPDCLDSIRSWVDEIIVVDTGSNDRSVSIAISYGAKVFNQQWEGDFSKHRNFSIEQAASDWVFIIDADERLCEEDVSRLKELINSDQHSIISINVFNVYGNDEKMTTFLPSIRLFRRDLNLRYEGIVHNRLVFPEDARIVRANIKLKHLGYDLSPEQMRKKFERSHALLEKQLQKNPDDFFAMFNLAQLLRGAGKDKPDLFGAEIIKLASRAVLLTNAHELSCRNVHLMCLDQLGWAYFYKGDLKQALVFAQRALSHKPDYLDPLLLIGHIYTHSKDYEKARTAYRRYIDIQAQYDPTAEKDNIILLNPDGRANAFYGLGLIGEIMGNAAEARQYYEKTIELNPDYLDVQMRKKSLDQNSGERNEHFELGVKYLNENDLQSAIEHFNSAVENSLNRRRLVLKIAQKYFEKSQYNEAAGHYQLWLEAFGQDAAILNDLANCYFKLKEFEKALECYESAAENPNAPVLVYRNLGLTCSILKHYAKGIIALRRYMESHPEDPEIVSIMGDLCLNVGDFKAAMPFYEKSLSYFPTDYNAIFNLSECYLNLGHEDSARIGYNRVLELNADFEPVKKRLAQMEGVSTSLS